MKRAVPDTNILVSAFVFGGLPAHFLELASCDLFRPVTSPTLLDELDGILRGRFRWSLTKADEVRNKIEATFDIVSTTISIAAIKDDPDDDRVLECAFAGQADYIVSGDKHLLKLAEYREIRILTVRQLMDILTPLT